MFTGIISEIGTIASVEPRGDLRIHIHASAAMRQVAIGGSIACSGACLTVVAQRGDGFVVDVSGETVARTRPGLWAEGARLNLERAVRVGDELGGHLVTGHVDGVGTVAECVPMGDSLRIAIDVEPVLGASIAAKGSVTVDGVSLTVNMVSDIGAGDAARTRFTINLIPHSAAVTTLGALAVGDAVNIEIDLIARYLARLMSARLNSQM